MTSLINWFLWRIFRRQISIAKIRPRRSSFLLAPETGINYLSWRFACGPRRTPESSRRLYVTKLSRTSSAINGSAICYHAVVERSGFNESFANMMEYVYWRAQPNLAYVGRFTNEVTAALRDSLTAFNRVWADVNHPDEIISTLFDPAIVYAKGGRLLVMVRNLLMKKHFALDLNHILKNSAYKNTVGNDLWQELESAAVSQSLINERLISNLAFLKSYQFQQSRCGEAAHEKRN